MTREELQIQSLSLIKQSNRVALQWCTGLGKSKIAIDMANYLADKEFKEHEEPFNVLLVVAETAHKSNWKMEFDRWGLKTNNIVMECYASLKKYRNSYWDLVIFDEAHHLGSDLRMDVLTELHAKNIILLSATLSDQVMQAVTGVFGEFVTSKVTLKEAIEWRILPAPKVYLIPKKEWYGVSEEAQDMICEDVELQIQGYDIDDEVLKMARANASLAGVEKKIHFQRRDIINFSSPKKYGFVISNPPYGERLSDKKQMEMLYRSIGQIIKENDTWSFFLLSGYEEAQKMIGKKATKNRKIYNGMMKTYLYQYMGEKPPRHLVKDSQKS